MEPESSPCRREAGGALGEGLALRGLPQLPLLNLIGSECSCGVKQMPQSPGHIVTFIFLPRYGPLRSSLVCFQLHGLLQGSGGCLCDGCLSSVPLDFCGKERVLLASIRLSKLLPVLLGFVKVMLEPVASECFE